MACQPPPGDPLEFVDELSEPSGDRLLDSVLAQTPRGRAWRTDQVADGHHNSYQHRFWRSVCDALADVYAKAWKYVRSTTACTLSGPEDPGNDTLADWEAEWGLPEPCMRDQSLTVDDRKFYLRMKIADVGGQSIEYFKCLAQQLGYSIDIIEGRVFRCGIGSCGGDLQLGHPANEVIWIVRLTTAQVWFFRCGASRCGRDPLGDFERAKDLECAFNKWNPANTHVVFSYEYTGAPPPPFT